MPFRSTVITSLAFLISTSAISSGAAFGAALTKNAAIVIANSQAADSSAKRIGRAVANETLKTISTKDAPPRESLPTIEKVEDSEPILPTVVTVDDAPGVREPATAEEAAPALHPPTIKPVANVVEPSVSPDKAVQWLQNGNKRYLKKSNRGDGKSQADRDRLKKSQKPYAVVLSCSDSRVPPETVFDQALGEIYVIRTLGENLDATVIASIEYAVENLGPKLVVVMGHTSCSAVSAAVASSENKSLTPSLESLIADIRPRLPSRGPAGVASDSLEIESAANAQGVAADLLQRSSVIRARVEKGELVIKPALYYLDSGLVKFY